MVDDEIPEEACFSGSLSTATEARKQAPEQLKEPTPVGNVDEIREPDPTKEATPCREC